MVDEPKPPAPPPPPAPIEPTAAQLRAEIEVLKTQMSGMVPGSEKTRLEVEVADLRAQLAALQAPPTAKPGFFPKLF